MIYGCNQCQYKVSHQGHLKKHMIAVYEGVRYNCSECELTFVWHRDKKYGYLVDEGTRYDCSQCEY